MNNATAHKGVGHVAPKQGNCVQAHSGLPYAYAAGERKFDAVWLRAETTREIREYDDEDFAELALELFGHQENYDEAQFADEVARGFRDALEHNGWPRNARFAP